MNDPHVDWLSYRIELGAGILLVDRAPIEHETDDFKVALAVGKGLFKLKSHFATAKEARACVDPFVRAWEIDDGLRTSPGQLRFVYENYGVIDRNPTPGLVHAPSFRAIATVGPVTVATGREYPSVPTEFKWSPTVQTLWGRYEGYKEGREPLAAMAYFCLTVIESLVGKRDKSACSRFRITRPVLRKLGELTKEGRGSAMTARKMDCNLKDHTPCEIQWIEATIREFIRRAGAREADLSLLCMSDLPPL
ncbi:MAG TPA: hypothetical protein VGL53_23940 [Bryobacteraceae bacterium]|jgi:hypothetical protein